MIIEVPYFKFANQYKLWILKNKLDIKKHNIDLKVYDGISNSQWNGGRVQNYEEPPKNINISFALTRHNNIDINDQNTLNILNINHKKGNSLILSNIELAIKLKDIFPNYTYIYSITAYDIKDGFDGYIELEKLFDYIVPRVEIFKDLSNFAKLDKSKYIPLYSYECMDCPLYTEHYNYIGNTMSFEHSMCWFKNKELFNSLPYDIHKYEYEYHTSQIVHMNMKKIKGFAGYKIGRNNQTFEKIEDELYDILNNIKEIK